MAKVNNKTKGFNSISRDIVYDIELSDRARFLYVYMACKPEGWEFYQDKVADELGYKKDTLRKYLDELITRGWIEEMQQQNEGKFGALEYTIRIERKKGENLPIRKKPDTEKTRNGKNRNHKNIDNISSDISISSDNKEIDKKTSKDVKKECVQTSFLPPAVNQEEENFKKKMKEKFPRIMSMQKPLTLVEAKRLKDELDEDKLYDIMTSMENYPKLHKCGVSANLTIRKWYKKEFASPNTPIAV